MGLVTKLNDIPLFFPDNIYLEEHSFNQLFLKWREDVFGRTHNVKRWYNRPNIKWVFSCLIQSNKVPAQVVQEWLDNHPNKKDFVKKNFRSVFTQRISQKHLLHTYTEDYLETFSIAINEEIATRKKVSPNIILNGKIMSEMTKEELQEIQISIDHALEEM